MKIVKFIESNDGYSIGETAGFPTEFANRLIEAGKAVEDKGTGKRKKLSDTVRGEKQNVDWAQVQRVTKELTGTLPKTKPEAKKLLQLD